MKVMAVAGWLTSLGLEFKTQPSGIDLESRSASDTPTSKAIEFGSKEKGKKFKNTF